jgi:hypothetical protein
MTTTTIIQIILGLLLALIIKKFYYSIIKIHNDIEKERQKEIETEIDKKNYWLIHHQKKLEENIKTIEKMPQYYEGSLNLIKKLSKFLDKKDRRGSEFAFFDKLICCYYFEYKGAKEQIKYLENKEDRIRLDFEKKEEQLKLEKIELEQKQQELELREAKIVKIESAQKILNSELVKKINKEIREDFLQFVKNNPINKN